MISFSNAEWVTDGGDRIVHPTSLELPSRGLTAIIGPNGAGKTSLLRMAAGIVRPSAGEVTFQGRALGSIPARERAQQIALMEQQPATQLDLSVRDVVELGRIPFRSSWSFGQAADDRTIVESVMQRVSVDTLADRRWLTLSGGERQRVQLARALAQQPSFLLLDEPINHLDIAHQIAFLELVQSLDICTTAVMHDLDLVAAFCDYVVVVADGRVIAHGDIDSTLTEELIRDVFNVTVSVSNTDRRRVTWHFDH